MQESKNSSKGERREIRAAQYLIQEHHCQLLMHQYQSPFAEIDLLLLHFEEIWMIEVKGPKIESFSKKQERRLKRAFEYLQGLCTRELVFGLILEVEEGKFELLHID